MVKEISFLLATFYLFWRSCLQGSKFFLPSHSIVCDQIFLPFCDDQPVVINIVNHLGWNVNRRVLFVPVIEEEFLVEYWFCRWFLTIFQFRLTATFKSFLISLEFGDCSCILILPLFSSIISCSFPIFSSLFVLLNLLFPFFSPLLGLMKSADNVFLSSFDHHSHPLVNQT